MWKALARALAVTLTFSFTFSFTGLLPMIPAAQADPIADFYRGRSLDMIVPTSPGGDYDVRARLIARHLGRHIPGNPTIVARNMPSGVGIGAANYIAKVAARDGSVLHAIMQSIPTAQAIGKSGLEADVRTFHWLGNTTESPNVINAWHTTGIRTIQDAMERELVVGSSGAASPAFIYPNALNLLVGTKFRIVSGYPGGNEINIAMEKGEVGGRGSNVWVSWKRGHPHWIAEKKINILVQVALKRAPDLPDVPLMLELAKNDEDRQVLTFLSADTPISRAFVTTPGVPAERVAALRKAFEATLKDPELLAEAEKTRMEITFTPGEECHRIAEAIVNTPPAVLARAKVLMEGPAR